MLDLRLDNGALYEIAPGNDFAELDYRGSIEAEIRSWSVVNVMPRTTDLLPVSGNQFVFGTPVTPDSFVLEIPSEPMANATWKDTWSNISYVSRVPISVSAKYETPEARRTVKFEFEAKFSVRLENESVLDRELDRFRAGSIEDVGVMGAEK